MLTMADLIAVLSLCLTSFGLGYAIGCNNKTTEKDSLDLFPHAWQQKNNRLLA